MSESTAPRRRWGSAYQLDGLLEQMPGDAGTARDDFALLTIAGNLAARYPGQLVFKGRFVLRHAHGILRFSTDVDGTRHAPAKHKLDSDEVAAAIREASVGDIVRFDPRPPATDSARSLDFDDVRIGGSLLSAGSVQVEISYREGVADEPERALIGMPFYEDFEILVLSFSEMAAEKLRTLAQRYKPTDLADLAVILRRPEAHDEDIARIAVHKFELVAPGSTNRVERIERRLKEMAADYDDAVPALFPDAPSYREATAIVWPRIKPLIP